MIGYQGPMAVPLRLDHRIEVRNKLRLTLTAEGVFEGVKRRYGVVSNRNSPPFSLDSPFSYWGVALIAGVGNGAWSHFGMIPSIQGYSNREGQVTREIEELEE
jgi:hypothetical protein